MLFARVWRVSTAVAVGATLGRASNLSGDWAGELDRAPVGTGFADWKKAVVLSKDGAQASIGFTNGQTGSLPRFGCGSCRCAVEAGPPSTIFARA